MIQVDLTDSGKLRVFSKIVGNLKQDCLIGSILLCERYLSFLFAEMVTTLGTNLCRVRYVILPVSNEWTCQTRHKIDRVG